MFSTWISQKKVNKLVYLILALLLIECLGSCKSHKKVNKYDDVYLEDVVEIPIKKKKKDKGGDQIGELIAREALTWIGTPYAYGRSEKGKGTDCSGLVLVVYEQVANIELPRNSAQQAEFCEELRERDIHPGDLVFFATGKDKNKVSHVGVMIDGKNFVHASGSKGVIQSEMTTPYYQRNFLKYGRVPR